MRFKDHINSYIYDWDISIQNALDLDQAEMETQLAFATDESFMIARNIYEQGSHSKPVAVVTLNTPLTARVLEGTAVSGRSSSTSQVTGTVYEDYEVGATEIKIQYDVISIQATHVGCQVGGSAEPLTDGCFAASGRLQIGGLTHNYTYSVTENNIAGRTLQGFSTQAEEKMYKCENCPYVTYNKFYEYYGEFDYADQWVSAAFDARATNFARGNADFSMYTKTGLTEAIKKGTVFMSVWMYTIRELEDAIDDCQSDCDPATTCNDDPVHAWDEAAAFYTGSLEVRTVLDLV